MLSERRRAVAGPKQIAWFEAQEQEPPIGKDQQPPGRSEVVDPWPLEDCDQAYDPLPIDERVESELALGNGTRVSRLGSIGVDRELG